MENGRDSVWQLNGGGPASLPIKQLRMSQMLAEVVFVSRLDLRLVVQDQNVLGVFFFGGAGEIEAAGGWANDQPAFLRRGERVRSRRSTWAAL